MQRYLSITANIEGDDLGRATGRIDQAIAAAGEPPRGVRVSVRGQVAPMTEMFRSLAVGLALSVVVILVLLTGYFQSFRLGLISIGGVPGVVCGVAIILLATGTTLNIESFMGSIMCIGVSVSNSVLLSTFMDDHWRAGATVRKAAVEGARDRLRPILMTAGAMVLGTMPMALALEEGSEMTAPLGLAVIGGLVVSTFATLLIVPAMFALVMGDAKKVSPSIDPDDPASRHYDAGEHARRPSTEALGPKNIQPFREYCDAELALGNASERAHSCRHAEHVRRTSASRLVILALRILAALAPAAAGCRNEQAEAKHAGGRRAGGPHRVPRAADHQLRRRSAGLRRRLRADLDLSKVSGFIEQYYADIGQKVKKGELLAEIFVPELDEEHQQKDRAGRAWTNSWSPRPGSWSPWPRATSRWPIAQLAEAKANVGKYQAEVVRWESEVKRLTEMVRENVVDKQVLAETQRQLDSSRAAQDAAQAAVTAREADLATSRPTWERPKSTWRPPRPRSRCPRRTSAQGGAMLAYTRVTAPYDGVVTVRNANTGDYVQAVTGDKSTANPSAIFVVARIDLVRVFVDVPEAIRPLHPAGDEGRRAGRDPQRFADSRRRHPHVLGDPREDQDVADRDRPADRGIQLPPPRNVRLYQGLRRAPESLRAAATERSSSPATKPTAICCKAARPSRRPSNRASATGRGRKLTGSRAATRGERSPAARR